MLGFVNKGQKSFDSRFCVAVNVSIGGYVLVEFRFVDVDVHHLGFRQIRFRVASNSVVEAHADGNKEVAVESVVVGTDVAVHA